MKQLTKYSASLYILLFVLGSLWLFAASAGALGGIFDWLGAVIGISFVTVAIYGIYRRQNFKRLPIAMKVLLGIGIVAVIAFAILMTAIVIALKNFT